MKKILILTTSIILLISSGIAYAAAVLVEGNMESLVALAGTPYVEEHPAIFLSDQQKANILKLLDKVEHLVITGALSFLALDALAPSQNIILSEKAVQSVAEDDGYYEIWVPQSVSIPSELLIKIDGRVIPLTDIRNKWSRRWYQISNAIYLKKGKNKIQLEGVKNISGTVTLIPIKEKERLINLFMDKIKTNKIQIGYLFTGTKDRPLGNVNFIGLDFGNYYLSGTGHFKLDPIQEEKVSVKINLNNSEGNPKGAGPNESIGYLNDSPLKVRRDLKPNEWDREYPFLGQYVQLSPKAYTLTWTKQEKILIDSVALYPSTIFIGKNETPPEIGFKKINPTRYQVTARKAQKPFWLVFSESFHEGWKAHIRLSAKGEGQREIDQGQEEEPWLALWSVWKDRGRRVEIKGHFLVNGYANAWYVIPSQAGADQFEIILEFKPQRLFEIGISISALTLLACFGYLFASYIRRRSKKESHEA